MTALPVPAENRAPAIATVAKFLAVAYPGKYLRVTVEAVKRASSQRSIAQNNYLFGVAYPPLVEVTGYPVNDIHEHMLGEHFGWVDRRVPRTPRNPAGIESVPFRTTTRNEHGKRDVLTKAQFADFVDRTVFKEAAKAGIAVPAPDPSLTERVTRAAAA
jgi:hypothetical protein